MAEERKNEERISLPKFSELVEMNLSGEALLSDLQSLVDDIRERVEEIKKDPQKGEALQEQVRDLVERLLNNYANNISIYIGKFLALLDSFPGLVEEERTTENLINLLKSSFRNVEGLVAQLKGLISELREGMPLEEFSARLEAWASNFNEAIISLEDLENTMLSALVELEETLAEADEITMLEDLEEDQLDEEEETVDEGEEDLEALEDLSEEEIEEWLDEEPSEEEVQKLMQLDERELESLVEYNLSKLQEDIEEMRKILDETGEDRDLLRELPEEPPEALEEPEEEEG